VRGKEFLITFGCYLHFEDKVISQAAKNHLYFVFRRVLVFPLDSH